MLGVAFLALTAGCSAGSTPSPAAAATGGNTTSAGDGGGGAGGPIDPCALLTVDQVTAAVGAPAAAGQQEPDFDAPECAWHLADPNANGEVDIGVGPWDGDPGVKPLRLGDPVSGVGDEAWADTTGLYVHSGAQGVRVWVFSYKLQAADLDQEKALATIILGKI
jgi:hypothetical protein